MKIINNENKKYVLDSETSQKITTVTKANKEILSIRAHRIANNALLGTTAAATIVTANGIPLEGTQGIIGTLICGTITLGMLGYQIYSRKKDKAKIEELRRIKEDIRIAKQHENNDYIKIVK